MLVILDAKMLANKTDAHRYLKEKLKFPDYYGNNLDALSDCLTDLTDLTVCFVNTEKAAPYYDKVRRVFEAAARNQGNIRIEEKTAEVCGASCCKLLALDMDGTVLNDRKEISEETKAAIHRALAAGREVVFCTGRTRDETKEILLDFPDMNYLCGESGALIYNLREKEIIRNLVFDENTVKRIKGYAADKDIMVQIFSNGRTIIDKMHMKRLADFYMSQYEPLYSRIGTVPDDAFELLEQEHSHASKINLYCRTPEEREVTMEDLKKEELDAVMVYSEVTSIECSPPGVSKADGLRVLTELLGISMQEVMMVGDEDNDLEAMKAVGFPIAMGNANERIKAISVCEVADNNHHGCAEAIDRYLLGNGLTEKEKS